jgi:hypothetical protein
MFTDDIDMEHEVPSTLCRNLQRSISAFFAIFADVCGVLVAEPNGGGHRHTDTNTLKTCPSHQIPIARRSDHAANLLRF